MTKKLVKLTAACTLLASFSSVSAVVPDRPIPQVPTNPIEELPIAPPIEPAPEHPTLPEPDNGIPGVPERPKPQLPTNPIEEQPVHPIEDSTPPNRPQPASPEQPIERDTTDDRLIHLEGLAAEYDYRLNQQAEQMDGVRASLHAVTNARPYATNGELAIGAGVGFAGSKEAIAIGGAYGLTDQVSLSGTFHYESSGKYSSSDVAGGIGIQFNFR
ncbi:YadA C-terminal domain-containing protein [Vibrio rotiferianus]|uniref:YadA C-terminal domain-containing protein n=1 Tax=Vibrio rotiferianus TaxID=190895 RepID=UPI0005EDEAA2|nr:YadA C-terminal domain-containing protein [Vibrio rotiferianus]